MRDDRKMQRKGISKRLLAGLLTVGIIAALFPTRTMSASEDVRRLQNGSFEKFNNVSWSSAGYAQPDQKLVDAWNTTAFGGKLELFKKNPGTYLGNGSYLYPSAGDVAAELNADEESTLFQTVSTNPYSIYEWGLDHSARTAADTMALVIGPAQDDSNNNSYLSKSSKAGRDQFMQMIYWLIEDQKLTSVKTIDKVISDKKSNQIDQFTVYSKKFDAKGRFQDNADGKPFSMTPSTIYTEEWHIWIIADLKADTNGKLTDDATKEQIASQWGHYGANAEGSAGSGSGLDNKVDLSKYYLYTVPANQDRTLFGFVSVGCLGNQGPTFGNFLDNINFQLYHALSTSTTPHGTAIIAGPSNVESEGGGSESTDDSKTISVDNKFVTYVTDGQPLLLQAKLTAEELAAGCEFVGVLYTVQENGKPTTKFLKVTDPGWNCTEVDGGKIYNYELDNLTSAVDLHFIFIKSPTITYDPNGGQAYIVEREYNTEELPNVYSFKPSTDTSGTMNFIPPYTSYAAVAPEGKTQDWKFVGWKLMGDSDGEAPSMLLDGKHTIVCDYVLKNASSTAPQKFKIYSGSVKFKYETVKSDAGDVSSVTWTPTNSENRVYEGEHKGLTMVAQWRWRQTAIPQVKNGESFSNSANGGTVEFKNLTSEEKKDYCESGANGTQYYFAQTDETVVATAAANQGYTFLGWYDSDGNELSKNTSYGFIEGKEEVHTVYARFENSLLQKYIRQVKEDGTWKETTDDAIGILNRYELPDVYGTVASSTAEAKNNYVFVGWYDGPGTDANLITTEETLSYTIQESKTYYARFETGYTVNFATQTQYSVDNIKNDNVGGKVNPTSGRNKEGGTVSSTMTANEGYQFLGWFDMEGNKVGTSKIYQAQTGAKTNMQTYYARFEPIKYSVKFIAQTKQPDGTFKEDTAGGNVTEQSITAAYNTDISSTAVANSGCTFLGWYDGPGSDAKLVTSGETYGLKIPASNKNYYARFEISNEIVGEVKLSFIAENDTTEIPDAFSGRHAGNGKYGNQFGNTIATGFQYKIGSMNGVSTIQITVTVPDTAYVKVGGTGNFTGNGNLILTDSDGVKYNKGSIQQINSATTLIYYWDAYGLQANTTYGFIIDNLYAPGATAKITVNGTSGIKVTNDNGVVNTTSVDYRSKSHYPK